MFMLIVRKSATLINRSTEDRDPPEKGSIKEMETRIGFKGGIPEILL